MLKTLRLFPALLQRPEVEADKFKSLSEKEKAQPLCVDCLVSNDVLEYEIQLLKEGNPDQLDDTAVAIR
jgi:hypothetical protein